MKKLAERFWNEPAFCVGVLGSVAMIVLKVVAQKDAIHGLDDVAQVLTPVVAGLLTRRWVSPSLAGQPNTMVEPPEAEEPRKKRRSPSA